ncbi:hypothetical protein DL95DRAFT_406896 [Leptodontidium sp. 2 PMI_412]|nr:hypothetical protein DL95DRAFT_406896 [Leptodontidium sp. 2 PMI_412]
MHASGTAMTYITLFQPACLALGRPNRPNNFFSVVPPPTKHKPKLPSIRNMIPAYRTGPPTHRSDNYPVKRRKSTEYLKSKGSIWEQYRGDGEIWGFMPGRKGRALSPSRKKQP